MPQLVEEEKLGWLRKRQGGVEIRGGRGGGGGGGVGTRLGFSSSLRPGRPVGPAGARGGQTYDLSFPSCIVVRFPFPFHVPPRSESSLPLLGSTLDPKRSVCPWGALP